MVIGPSYSLSYFKVETLQGEAEFMGKPLKQGEKVEKGGLLKVSRKSFLGILLPEWNARLVLSPGSQLEVDFDSKEGKKILIKKGALRWTSLKLGDSEKLKRKSKKGFLFTSHAKVVIRGTDFFLQIGSAFQETELVVLDGKILFQSLSDEDDYVVLKSPFWVGLGGRFSSKIGKPIKLNQKTESFYHLILSFK